MPGGPRLQIAGNVLVYGAGAACSYEWIGGVNADDAEEFLAVLLAVKVQGCWGLRGNGSRRN